MIDQEYSLEDWLQDYSKREQAILALRAAARVFPAITRDTETGMTQEHVADLILPHFRQIICGLTFCYFDETPLENALKEAIRGFGTGFSSHQTGAATAARCARDAASSAVKIKSPSGKRNAWKALSNSEQVLNVRDYDLRFFHELEDLHKNGDHAAAISKPLWEGAARNQELEKDFRNLMDLLSEDFDSWSYFISWFQRYWSGAEINWDFTRLVSLLPNKIWEEGIASLSYEIEVLKEREIFAKFPVAEDVVIDEATGRFEVVPIEKREPLRLDVILSRTTDALEDAISSHNGLRENSWAAKTLIRSIGNYNSDPQRIEMDFTSVSLRLRRQVDVTSELADSDENLALIEVLEDGVRSLRGIYPEIAENRRIIAHQKIQELSAIDRENLRKALPLLEKISQGMLRQDFEYDVASITGDPIEAVQEHNALPPSTKVDASARIFSRAAKIRAALRVGDTVEKIEGSTGFKAAKIITTVAGVIGIGLTVFGIL